MFAALFTAVVLAQADAPPRPTPSLAVRAALGDASQLDPVTAKATRYLYAGHVDGKDRAELYAVISGHVNLISREGVIVRPRRVNDWLWAVDLRNYGTSAETYAGVIRNPNSVESYFHVEPIDAAGKTSRPLIYAPWLPSADVVALEQITNSKAPVLRADWLLHRTGMQEGRGGFKFSTADDGHGYYDLLGLKSRTDAEKLAGLDRSKAIAISRETGAVVPVSGVAVQGRQVFRYVTLGGSWWETRDTKGDRGGYGARNPERLYLEDYKHDAEEIVATLPNRLPFFYLSDSTGKQADSAPPDIASDGKSTSNDRRVHPPLSCIRCHGGALKPFADHARALYAAGGTLALSSTDAAKLRRLRSAYLGPIEKYMADDVAGYSAAFKEASGLDSTAFAAAYSRQWSRYADEPVTLTRLAEEIGADEAELLDRLQRAAELNVVVDPVIAGLLQKPPRSVRREQIEEAWPLIMQVLSGGK